MKNIQDERSVKLYGDAPIAVPESKYPEIISKYQKAFERSEDWFTANYQTDFIRYLANYRSITGDIIKPWPESNTYFMPSTNITIENYVARTMETIRGARDFLTVFPRGMDDVENARVVELYLRYMFEQPMKGFQKVEDVFRTKFIYGTSIAHMPWSLEIYKVRVPGEYIWDRGGSRWITEIQEIDGKEIPKDFEGLDMGPLLRIDDNYVMKDLFNDVEMKDQPDLEMLDLFNVKIDPNGGPDIQKHAYTIIETIETLDTIKRKAAQGIYDHGQVENLETWLNSAEKEENPADDNQAIEARDAVEDITNDSGVRNGIKIWIIYGREELGFEKFEEEIVGIIAETQFILRFGQTRFQNNGIPFRPLLVDRFITLPHRFYGIGIGEILEPLQYLLNHLVNQVLNHGDLMNSPPLIVPAEGQWDPSDNIFGPAQTWFSDNTDGFKILDTPDIKPSQLQMITFVEGFIQKSLGINDYTLGGGSGSIVNNDTAHGIANVLRETNRRVDFYARNSHENFIKAMFEMVLKESQQFMDDIEITRITDLGKEGPEFSANVVQNANIQGMYDLKIYADSLTASKEFEQVKSQNFVQVLSQLIDPMTQAPLYDMKTVGDKFIESYGEPFPERYHSKVPQSGQGGATEGGPKPVEADQPKPEGRLGPINSPAPAA